MKTALALVVLAAVAATLVAFSAQGPFSPRGALAAWPGARTVDPGVDPFAPLCRARSYGRCPGPA